MFLSLLFHKIGSGKYGTEKKLLFKHLLYLKNHYPLILPGEDSKKKMAISLTFDDATADFYLEIFPFLQENKIPAILAVPVGYIPDRASLSSSARLSIPSRLPHDPLAPSEGFCSWEEIRKMHSSQLIHIASHGFSHHKLTDVTTDLVTEITLSKRMIEEKIKNTVTSFVYPMGIFSRKVHNLAKREYQYLFRIGSALNFSWNQSDQMIYRICGDHLNQIESLFTCRRYFSYMGNFLLNRIRHR